MLLVLITGQLAIVGQLGREIHLWRIWLFLGNGNGDGLEEDVLVDKAAGDGFALFWETVVWLEVEVFPCFQKWDSRASFSTYLV